MNDIIRKFAVMSFDIELDRRKNKGTLINRVMSVLKD